MRNQMRQISATGADRLSFILHSAFDILHFPYLISFTIRTRRPPLVHSASM